MYVCTCMHACIYVCMYVCVYAHIGNKEPRLVPLIGDHLCSDVMNLPLLMPSDLV